MTKIAIACQGGGSQTAFTAGVLISLLKNQNNMKNQIIGLSGTSGGAICATLAWAELLQGGPYSGKTLEAFWTDNACENKMEWFLNEMFMEYARLVNIGLIPSFHMSPYYFNYSIQALKKLTHGFYDLEGLLDQHIKFDDLNRIKNDSSPTLLIGAANVKSGEHRIFNSRKEEVCKEMLLASAAVPSLFEAAQYKGSWYWDGLFSDNPPVDQLLLPEHIGPDNTPKQLWIIQINPDECSEIPKAPDQIDDRLNEMMGNISLKQGLKHICRVNRWIRQKAFHQQYIHNHLEEIEIFIIKMSSKFLSDNHDKLGSSSKLNRDRRFINELMDHGIEMGEEFVKKPLTMKYPCP